jgi:hypothetical protein
MSGTTHRCGNGDCVASLGLTHGLTTQRVWEHPDNQTLRQRTEAKPELCATGDEVTLPQLEKKSFDGATEARHRFRRLGRPLLLRVRFLEEGEPRVEASYMMTIEGSHREGTLDQDGLLEESIPPTATEARVRIEDRDSSDEYLLMIGSLEPIETRRGKLQRLYDLGFEVDPERGDPSGEQLAGIIGQFQKDHDLEVTGELNEPTVQALRDAFGC